MNLEEILAALNETGQALHDQKKLTPKQRAFVAQMLILNLLALGVHPDALREAYEMTLTHQSEWTDKKLAEGGEPEDLDVAKEVQAEREAFQAILTTLEHAIR